MSSSPHHGLSTMIRPPLPPSPPRRQPPSPAAELPRPVAPGERGEGMKKGRERMTCGAHVGPPFSNYYFV
uniref:Uncharacterized protein n=1 Tax=Oryza sativa subsp. japonica TaxID=39947 RepID=Q6Z1J8_ORYSJ|nr:unknown protein [Oryza sativa Japonica Group]